MFMENLLLLGWQYFPNPYTALTQSLSKSQQAYLQTKDQSDTGILIEMQRAQSRQNYLEKEQSWKTKIP